MTDIFIQNHKISFEQIQLGQWPELSNYYQESLTFCRQWLNGREKFELQTSGSTGKPKKIMVSRQQMESSAKATGDFFKISKNKHLLCCLNTGMIAGKMMLVRAMQWNCNLTLIEPKSNPLEDFVDQNDLDFVAMVPSQVETSLISPKTTKALQNIKHLIIGGAPISEELKTRIAKLEIQAYQTYGMTETVSHIALAPILPASKLTYHTLPGVQISQDKEGKLIIKAPMALTELHTNDLVEILNEQQFIWKGRADFTINSGGIKLQPEEIEKKLSLIIGKKLPATRYFIAGAPHPKWGEQVILVVESQRPNTDFLKEFSQSIKSTLGSYENPKTIYFVDNFIETASGKINRIKSLEQVLKNP
ncbi:AMP-binding protein [Echinicola marina]|uniref:AMP-binding protein n=1 Tax=Echinicola marina TaxID=2859768 RepID=UPI001CF64483|nr:AMP-binding protein [Echinicola marina]UCS95634.1 AMP-binding protein [Echinicola marina]